MYSNHSHLPPPLPLMSCSHPLLEDFPAFLLASLPPPPPSAPPSGCHWNFSEADLGTCGHRLPLHLLSPGTRHFVPSHSQVLPVLLRAPASSPTVLPPPPSRSQFKLAVYGLRPKAPSQITAWPLLLIPYASQSCAPETPPRSSCPQSLFPIHHFKQQPVTTPRKKKACV